MHWSRKSLLLLLVIAWQKKTTARVVPLFPRHKTGRRCLCTQFSCLPCVLSLKLCRKQGFPAHILDSSCLCVICFRATASIAGKPSCFSFFCSQKEGGALANKADTQAVPKTKPATATCVHPLYPVFTSSLCVLEHRAYCNATGKNKLLPLDGVSTREFSIPLVRSFSRAKEVSLSAKIPSFCEAHILV